MLTGTIKYYMYKCATYKTSHVTELISACSSDCVSCQTNGAGKCDSGHCNDGFGLDADNTCKGKACRNYYFVLPHSSSVNTGCGNYNQAENIQNIRYLNININILRSLSSITTY